MIDFRYHLVSLISVFLALAVGVVLGAGPLREQIGDTLTDQVTALRQEKDTLRTDLATARAGVDHRDGFVDAVAPGLIRQQLLGRSVVLVRLPGVEDSVLEPLTESVEGAGGVVTGRVEIGDAWTDPDQATLRDQLVTQLATSVPADAAEGDTPAELASLLGRALMKKGAAGVGRPDAAATTVRSSLDQADLVSLDGDLAGTSDLAIVLAPAVPESGSGQVQPTPDADAAGAYVTIARALDAAGAGAVVVGPASSATGGGIVSAVRGDDVANRSVTTVDTGGTPMGVVATVLGLRQQGDGGTGRYGFGDGASAPLPEVPPIAAAP